MTHPKIDLVLSQTHPWDDNPNPTWLASTLSFSRNMAKHKFPSKLEGDRQRQLVDVIANEVRGAGLLDDPTLLLAEKLTPIHREYLIEHFLSQHSFQQAHAGEAFIVDKSGTFLGTLNIGDHLRLQFVDISGELETAWNRLVSLEAALGKNLSYAFSQKYGFLTSDIDQCGTGLNVSVFLQLPGLIHTDQLDSLLERVLDDSVMITGIQGNPTEMIGDILVLQNNYTLGVSEEGIISNMRTIITKILLEEQAAKKELLKTNNVEVMDRVSRAFGILIHSYQIEAVEALNAISLLKLGVELKWIEGVSIRELNRLFFQCRRGHLLASHKNGEKLDQDKIPHERAQFIHSTLKQIHLNV